jgi:MYXO-CTERM domain-containing protein
MKDVLPRARVLALLAFASTATLAAAVPACSAHDGDPPVPSATTAPASTIESAAAEGFVRLPRVLPPAAWPERDRGPLDPGRRIENLSLAFRLTPAQRADREALRAAQLDPASPSYHAWLTPEQYAARFGADPAVVARASDWLASEGLEVHGTSRLGSRVTFAGTVDRLQSAFHDEMRAYEFEGRSHYAMGSHPQVPADLGPVVLDVLNTHDFYPRSMSQRVPAQPQYMAGSAAGFSPPDWASVYGVNAAYSPGIGGRAIDGSGVTIAVVGVAQVAQSDIDAWRSKFGLPASTVTMTLVPGTGASQGDNGSGFEAALDVEWSGGIGKGATIDYVYTGADDANVDDATLYAIENDLGSVISTSWGSCDGIYVQPPPAGDGYGSGDQNVLDEYASAANLMGITVVASSGDWGATACLDSNLGGLGGLYVSVPAAFPGVTAVGGTQFAAGSFVTGSNGYFTGYAAGAEHAWNEQNLGTGSSPKVSATGGGISVLFSRPSYQVGLATCAPVGSLPVSVTAANMRQIPDVSFTAGGVTAGVVPLFAMCALDSSNTDCTGDGGSTLSLIAGAGTSFSAPAFAGVVALMDQLEGGRMGNINPLLYALDSATAVHDVTAGNNEVSCNAGDPGCGSGGVYGYAAATGYDCATGIGSLDVGALLTEIASLAGTTTSLEATPTSTTEGTPVSLTATVSLASGASSSHSLAGGVVTFAFQSYDANGEVDLNAGSWTLGTGTLGGSTSSATASLSIAIPPGLVRPGAQSVDVYAVYGGDAFHGPSTSAKVTIDFAALSLAITPIDPEVKVGGSLAFHATGATTVKWYTGNDSTCTAGTMQLCSGIDPSTGAFTAGGGVGTTQVFAIDPDGAYALTTAYVGEQPPDGGSGAAGAPDASRRDSGNPSTGAPDGGLVAAQDAGRSGDATTGGPGSGGAGGATVADDGSSPSDDGQASGDDGAGSSGGKGGCSCEAAGSGPKDPGAAGLAGAMALGFTLRRRRRKGDSPVLPAQPSPNSESWRLGGGAGARAARDARVSASRAGLSSR